MTEKQYDEEGRVIRENRSQAKREREHIKTFARELLKLPAHQYPLLPIDETLQAALVEGKRLSGNALSRHLNYLTRLLDEQETARIWQCDPPIRVRKSVPDFWLQIQICEGKNRQVRRMTAKAGYPCLRLIRVGIGRVNLFDLGIELGQWRECPTLP